MKPQARKVLRHLKAAGAEGVHSRELRADFIADPPSRICELRRSGYDILRKKEGNGTRYILRPGSSPNGGGGLFSPCAPATDPFSGPVLETRALSPGHRWAHQPPDERNNWVLVHDYRDRAHPIARWELRQGSTE